MTRALSAFVVLFGLMGLAATAAADAQTGDAGATTIDGLLSSASKAVRTETYKGVIVYLRRSKLDTLRIVHRSVDGNEQERLLSMSGQPREVIRRGNVVTSVLPENKVVLISRQQRKGLLGSVAHFSPQRMRESYIVSDMGDRRLADRSGRLIQVAPRDAYRYGYRMLVDRKTHLPLKLDLMRGGDVLEQMMFTSIDFPGHIPDKAFKPSYDIDGYRVIQHESVQIEDKPVPQDEWQATDLPPGFELARDGVRRITKDGYVRQLLFTDGVATVSAFLAPAGLRKPLKGATTMGAISAFGRVVDDTQITVVGEVPTKTVKQIAENLVKTPARDKAGR